MIGDSLRERVLGARGAGTPPALLVDRRHARTIDDFPVIMTLDALPAESRAWRRA